MANKQQLIEKAFDTASGNSSLVHLNTQNADRFIDYITDESKILKSSRVIRMSKPKQDIAKINISEDVFYPAAHWQELDSSKYVKANSEKLTLSTKEVIWEVVVYDDELEDNIEGNAFKDHLMRMIAKKASNQLEKVALYGKDIAGDTLEYNFDGYVKTLKNEGAVVDVANTSLFSDRFIDKEKLAKMRKAIPTKYRSILNAIYMPDDLAVDYEVSYEKTQNTVAKNSAFGINFTRANLLRIDGPVAVAGWYTTTLTANANKGDTVVTVNDVTDATAGMEITFNLWEDKEFTTSIVSVDTDNNTITIEDALLFDLDSSSLIENAIAETTSDWSDVIMTPANNLIWWIQRDITIEPYRQPRLRATSFVLTARIDFKIENPEMACLGKNFKVK